MPKRIPNDSDNELRVFRGSMLSGPIVVHGPLPQHDRAPAPEAAGGSAAPTPTETLRAMHAVVEGRVAAPQAPQAPTVEELIAREDAMIQGVVDRMVGSAVRIVSDQIEVAASVRPPSESLFDSLLNHHTERIVSPAEVGALRDRLVHRREVTTRDHVLGRVRHGVRSHIAAARAAATAPRFAKFG